MNWQRAHIELLEARALPVRTHHWQPPPEPVLTKPERGALRRAATAELRRRIHELLAAGVPEREIAEQLEVSRTTVQYHRRGCTSQAPKKWRR